jgi:hypothetical protein
LGQLKKRELSLPQDPSSTPIKMMEQANKIEELGTKPRKVLYEVDEQKSPAAIRFSNRWVYPIFRSTLTNADRLPLVTDGDIAPSQHVEELSISPKVTPINAKGAVTHVSLGGSPY